MSLNKLKKGAGRFLFRISTFLAAISLFWIMVGSEGHAGVGREAVLLHEHVEGVCYTAFMGGKVYLCNKEPSEIDASLSINADVSQWVRGGLRLSANFNSYFSEVRLASNPYNWCGWGRDGQGSITVNANGNYSVTVYLSDGRTLSDDITISNIDNEPPVISAVTADTTNWAEAVTINVSASDRHSGLHSSGYCFDGTNYTGASSYTVRSNGTYTVSVRDACGNVSTKSITVNNIDNKAPVITSFGPDRTDWTSNTVTLSVNATDSESGLAPKAYSFDGGNTYTSSSSFNVSSNGNYSVCVKDVAGHVSTASCNVSCIDKEIPLIKNVSVSTEGWTNGDVSVSVDASDAGSGLIGDAYSFDGGRTFGSSSSYTVNVNKGIDVVVRDAAGNTASKSISISNIDKNSPGISTITASTSSWTNGNISISVAASDSESGLASKAYSFNGGAYAASSSYDVSENGVYSVTVIDNAGNTTDKSINISNIDKNAPNITEITKSTDDWTQSLSISVNATDDLSGLADAAYSFDGGATYTSSGSYNIKKNGSYSVCVKDKAGNVATKSINIANIGKNPSQEEKERLEAEKEAEEKAKQEQKAKEEEKKAKELKDKKEAEYNKLLAELEAKISEVSDLTSQLNDISSKKESLTNQLNAAIEKQDENLIQNLSNAINELTAKESKLKTECDKKKTELSSLQSKLESLKKELNKADSDYESKIKKANEAQKEMEQARKNADEISKKAEAKSNSGFISGIINKIKNKSNSRDEYEKKLSEFDSEVEALCRLTGKLNEAIKLRKYYAVKLSQAEETGDEALISEFKNKYNQALSVEETLRKECDSKKDLVEKLKSELLAGKADMDNAGINISANIDAASKAISEIPKADTATKRTDSTNSSKKAGKDTKGTDTKDNKDNKNNKVSNGKKDVVGLISEKGRDSSDKGGLVMEEDANEVIDINDEELTCIDENGEIDVSLLLEDDTTKSTQLLKANKNILLYAGIILLLVGGALACSFSYVYIYDGKRIVSPVLATIKHDKNKSIIYIKSERLKEGRKYRIYRSVYERLLHGKNILYISVEGRDSIITTEGNRFFTM